MIIATLLLKIYHIFGVFYKNMEYNMIVMLLETSYEKSSIK